jgi:hypothetical protein
VKKNFVRIDSSTIFAAAFEEERDYMALLLKPKELSINN